ncbi:hypothetical protein [Massilia cavernae]|uniref:hypothetical protein n=1 Tax=Massilia cavernae TaxID=2320864 RepID=UPI00160357E9|nr:hypothetical protein [Massilia cavernae]
MSITACKFLAMDAGAILATFGVKQHALLEVLSGRFKPTGKLPFASPSLVDPDG